MQQKERTGQVIKYTVKIDAVSSFVSHSSPTTKGQVETLHSQVQPGVCCSRAEQSITEMTAFCTPQACAVYMLASILDARTPDGCKAAELCTSTHCDARLGGLLKKVPP